MRNNRDNVKRNEKYGEGEKDKIISFIYIDIFLSKLLQGEEKWIEMQERAIKKKKTIKT